MHNFGWFLMFLVEAVLDEVACKYLPEFGNNGKEFISIRQLLTHTAGLREFYPFFDMGLTKREEVKYSCILTVLSFKSFRM